MVFVFEEKNKKIKKIYWRKVVKWRGKKKRDIYKVCFCYYSMKKIHAVIIVLLIVAVIFSVASVSMNLSLGSFEGISESQKTNLPEGESDGNLNLVIETSGSEVGV